MNVLLIGTGVIGSVYGCHLALDEHRVWVLAHGDREKEIDQNGIRLHNIDDNTHKTAKASLAKNTYEREYDLVIVAVNANQLPTTFPALRELKNNPYIVILGNNPEGHTLLPHDLPGTVALAFPGVAGNIKDGIVDYVRIAQQPTTLEITGNPVEEMFEATLRKQGFSIEKTNDMDGWLAYHAVFISCIGVAIIRSRGNAIELGQNKQLLHDMCVAIEEGFKLLKTKQMKGLPRNLAILHSPLLRPIAIRYWSTIMRSPKGELYFAAHAKHSPEEIHMLKNWVIQQCSNSLSNTRHLLDFLRVEEI